MTPEQFIQKWKSATLTERAAAQSHFIDLCRLLDEPTPTDADPLGEFYCFERGATKTTGGEGWADVWKRGHFGWEYKGKRKDLNAAFGQLQQYALALENPPLLVVCDLDRFRVHTNWTNTISRVHELTLDDLRDPEKRAILKAVLSDPERLKPGQTRAELTEKAAGDFGELARRLRERGHHPEAVAHFVNRLVFCMFAEDVHLLPNQMFRRMLDAARMAPVDFQSLAADLFRAMRQGGRVGFETVEWFNGGLFDTDDALPLDHDDIALALRVADLDWSEVDPSIFGTLFERGLDPDKRSQLGAHYTDREKIMLIIQPVIISPWLTDWTGTKAKIEEALSKAATATGGTRTRFKTQAEGIYRAFLDRLRAYRVLDPACGSGNFLYLALLALKDMELRVSIEAEALGLSREFPQIGPEVVKGIEINPYAAELARVTVWIGEIQWMRRNGFNAGRNPILKPLDTIECRDALLDSNGAEAVWPPADAIVGNPPFLGGKRLLSVLGAEYTERLRKVFEGRLPAFIDLVAYWLEKSSHLVGTRRATRAGLVATNSIAGGSNLVAMKRLSERCQIFDAWSDEPWTVDGAAVRVSVICMVANGAASPPLRLNGQPVAAINSDLTSSAVDLTTAKRLPENSGVCFEGGQKHGPFEVTGEQARAWLSEPLNPNGRPNSDVLRRFLNGADIVRRMSDDWVVDFGYEMSEGDAALYAGPFKHVFERVKPIRMASNLASHRDQWWRHHRTRPELRKALAKLTRYIATPVLAKHRIFVWLAPAFWPTNLVDAIARDDDVTFGILHSRFHEAWALRLGTSLEDRPRYTPSTTFETFPFPDGLTPNLTPMNVADDPRAQRITQAAVRLNSLRENWLNPVDLVVRAPEAAAGYPDRLLPKDDAAAAILKRRTLTNLYNERPTWLANAHADLDVAVAAAYGWPADISEDDALARLFALNQERAATPPQSDA